MALKSNKTASLGRCPRLAWSRGLAPWEWRGVLKKGWQMKTLGEPRRHHRSVKKRRSFQRNTSPPSTGAPSTSPMSTSPLSTSPLSTGPLSTGSPSTSPLSAGPQSTGSQSANGGALYQPGATPQERRDPRAQGLKARPKRQPARFDGSDLWPSNPIKPHP